MCTVSMVMDEGQKLWPNPGIHPQAQPWNPLTGQTVAIPMNIPTAEEIAEFRKLLEAAKKLDVLTNQPDCEDPKKVEWLKDFCERLRNKSDELALMANELEKTLEA